MYVCVGGSMVAQTNTHTHTLTQSSPENESITYAKIFTILSVIFWKNLRKLRQCVNKARKKLVLSKFYNDKPLFSV